MNLVCPCCQAVFPLEAALSDVAARAAVSRAFTFTPFGDLLLGYVSLFKPPQRALSMPRVVHLLDELIPMIEAGRIERQGRIWPAPQEYWRQALQEMVDKRDQLTLPLRSHGYLLTIIVGYSARAEAKAETKAENRRAGRTPVGGQAAPAPQPTASSRMPMPDIARQQLAQFRNPQQGDPHG